MRITQTFFTSPLPLTSTWGTRSQKHAPGEGPVTCGAWPVDLPCAECPGPGPDRPPGRSAVAGERRRGPSSGSGPPSGLGGVACEGAGAGAGPGAVRVAVPGAAGAVGGRPPGGHRRLRRRTGARLYAGGRGGGRKEKEPPTKPGWANPRTTARPPCSVNRPGHHAGARATRVNQNGAHATRKAHATRGHQGARHAHARPTEWWSAGGGRPVQQAEHNPRFANYWAPLTHKRRTMAHSAQPRHTKYWANAETTPAGAPAAAADRTQRPNATCGGKTG